jgi:hypothetical protein
LEQLTAAAPNAAKLFDQALEPLRVTLKQQRYISGAAPFYSDYVVCSAFQWINAIGPTEYSDEADTIARWRLDVLRQYELNLSQT